MLMLLVIDLGYLFLYILNFSLNLVVEVCGKDGDVKFVCVKILQLFDCFILVFVKVYDDEDEMFFIDDFGYEFVVFEEVIVDNLGLFFFGFEVDNYYIFWVMCDVDFEIEEDEVVDLLMMMVEVVGKCYFGFVVCFEIGDCMLSEMCKIFISYFGFKSYQVYKMLDLLVLLNFWQIVSLDIFELRDLFFQFYVRFLLGEESIWSVICSQDWMFYYFYDSFSLVVDFICEVVCDLKVVVIKQMFYWVGKDLLIVEVLMEVCENGKQVVVFVEFKVCFDEENNIGWVWVLEDVGVYVVYGFVGFKMYVKMCLVVWCE